ncbi:MAG: tyrosine-type recombinase/integrase [Candidatus Pristimantibacillus sp.]
MNVLINWNWTFPRCDLFDLCFYTLQRCFRDFQITSSTLIVGVNIAKFKHVARAQDYRGVEFGKPITFENTQELVKDGRYAVPSIPQGIYAELREAMKFREHLTTDLCVVQARVHNWLDRYFPEFLKVLRIGNASLPSKCLASIYCRMSLSMCRIYPHRFRHTYACQLLDIGAHLDFIQGMFGHEKASTTQIYAQFRGERRRELYRRFF